MQTKPGQKSFTAQWFQEVSEHVDECAVFLDKSEITPMLNAVRDRYERNEVITILEHLEACVALFIYLNAQLGIAIDRTAIGTEATNATD